MENFDDAVKGISRFIRKFVFDRLPEQWTIRERARIARDAARLGTPAYIFAYAGYTKHSINEEDRKAITEIRKTIGAFGMALGKLLESSRKIDSLSGKDRLFSHFLNSMAEVKGITSEDGKVAERIMEALRLTGLLFLSTPPSVPEKIPKTNESPASAFDLAIAQAVDGTLSRKATARLIHDLRAELYLPLSTPGAIEQRIRDNQLR